MSFSDGNFYLQGTFPEYFCAFHTGFTTPFRYGISKYLMIGFRQLGSKNVPPRKLLWSSCWYCSCIKCKPITWVVWPNDCPIRTFPWFKHTDIFHVKKLPKNLSLQFLFSHVSLSSRSVCPSHSGTKTGHLTTPFGIFQGKPANQVLLRVKLWAMSTVCWKNNQSNIGIHSFEICKENESSEGIWYYHYPFEIDRPQFFWQEICHLCSSNMLCLVCMSALLLTTKKGNIIFTCTCILSLPFSNIVWYMYLYTIHFKSTIQLLNLYSIHKVYIHFITS